MQRQVKFSDLPLDMKKKVIVLMASNDIEFEQSDSNFFFQANMRLREADLNQTKQNQKKRKYDPKHLESLAKPKKQSQYHVTCPEDEFERHKRVQQNENSPELK